MATLLNVPEVAAGATEALLTEWLVEEGASYSQGDAIVSLETEKANVEVEAEHPAVLLRALAMPGNVVEVGSPMALIGSADEIDVDLESILASLGVTHLPSGRAAVRHECPPAPDALSGQRQLTQRVPISPLARKIATKHQIDIATLKGTGPRGRIVRKDVEAATEPGAKSTRAVGSTVIASEHPVGVPHSRLRRAVAARLTLSKQSVPHFYVKRSVDLDPLLTLRDEINAVAQQRLSVNDLLIKAVGEAHGAVPAANVVWSDESMHTFGQVDIAVAIASKRGLVTPVLRGVDEMTVSDIAKQVRAYVEQADTGKLIQSDLEGGSISITNLGMFGVDEFSAIINPPQSAILAVGSARRVPVVRNDVVHVGAVLTLVLSVDHRAIDGALAAEWMQALIDAITHPMRLLL